MTETALTRSAPRVLNRLPSGFSRLVRKRLMALLDAVRWGRITLHDPDGTVVLGAASNPGPRVEVHVHDIDFYACAGFGGSVGAGQSYFEGLWDCEQLTDLVRIMVRSRDVLDAMDGGIARLGEPLWRLFHLRRRNTHDGSRENISAHYDLSNAFFERMLGPSMMYSCAVFERGDETLEEAQFAKLERICRKLAIEPGQRLVEIGTGWGGFAIHAARHHGCHVTTTTISREQHDHAVAAVAAAGLSDRVTVLFEDYRDLTGRYDRLVSIEMIEAVGHQYFDTYFRKIGELLERDGMALIQAITIEDQRWPRYRDGVDFIKRFVFPGGCLPSVSVMLECAHRQSDLRCIHLEDIGPHYAPTLQMWRDRAHAMEAQSRAEGFDDAFLRLWDFYLAYCEGGFAERVIGDVQVLLAMPESRRPPVLGALAREVR